MIKSFRDLDVYKASYDLMIILHQHIFKLPVYETHDLTSQMRRASKSIPANIAEGWAKRNHEKEFKKHLDISLGSCNEMEVHIETCKDLKYLSKDFCEETIKKYQLLGGKIHNLKQRWHTY